jgi:competence protein ComEA
MPTRIQTSFWAFARKERRGILFLLFIITLLCLIPFLLPFLYARTMAGEVNIDSSLARLQADKELRSRETKYRSDIGEEIERPSAQPASTYPKHYEHKGELFYFDPNTIEEAGWRKLGLRDKTIATIINYRSKGGKFKEAEDLKKIWGLFPDEAERLIPFVKITDAPAAENKQQLADAPDGKKSSYSSKKYSTIMVNAVDSNELVSLPGIGQKLSARIINFRNKLGGFYSVDQVGETFGLPDSTFQKIKPYLQVDADIKKININTATLDELKVHPYIRYHIANAIVEYRKQHGNFKSVDELRKIMIIKEDILLKMSPYLVVE